MKLKFQNLIEMDNLEVEMEKTGVEMENDRVIRVEKRCGYLLFPPPIYTPTVTLKKSVLLSNASFPAKL